MSDEENRKRRQRAEVKIKVIDEKKQETVAPGERKFIGKGKTRVDVNPTLKSSAEQYGEKDKQRTAAESNCDPIASGARAMIRSTAKKIRMKKPVNETSQIDEVSRAKLARYKAAATDDLRGMSSLKKETDYPGRPKDNLDKKIKSRASFVKMAKRKMQEEQSSVEEGMTMLDRPVKMKYTGPSDSAFTNGEHVHVTSKPSASGAVRALDSKGRSWLVHRKHVEPVAEEIEQVDELSYDTLSKYRRASIDDSLKHLRQRNGHIVHKERLDKRKAGSKLAWSKMGMTRDNKPKVQSTEGEASKRRSAEIQRDSMKNVQPSTQAMKDAEAKLSDLAHKSAHLFKRPNQPYAALKPIRSEEHQFIADLRAAIESNGTSPVTFADGARAAISPGYADRILAKYEAISEESKRNEFVSTVSSSLKTLRESVKR